MIPIGSNAESKHGIGVDDNEAKVNEEVLSGDKAEASSEIETEAETETNASVKDDKNEDWENERRKAIERVKICGVVSLATSVVSVQVFSLFESSCDGEAGVEW